MLDEIFFRAEKFSLFNHQTSETIIILPAIPCMIIVMDGG
jgi:hypothetical protein